MAAVAAECGVDWLELSCTELAAMAGGTFPPPNARVRARAHPSCHMLVHVRGCGTEVSLALQSAECLCRWGGFPAPCGMTVTVWEEVRVCLGRDDFGSLPDSSVTPRHATPQELSRSWQHPSRHH